MHLESTQTPLKIFLVHPGDEIFLILDTFPYKAETKPVDATPEPYGELWISLEIKANKEDWKIDTALSCKYEKKQNGFIYYTIKG